MESGDDGKKIGVGLDLRKMAEAALREAPSSGHSARPAEELLHELQVHQIELEIQNEELRRAQLALEVSRDRYVDLYEFAPVGYLTLTREGLVAEANLTAATLLGVERAELQRRRFDRFVCPVGRDRWHRLFMHAFGHDKSQCADVTLQRADGGRFDARLDCVRIEAPAGPPMLRVVLGDISDRVRAEQALRDSKERYQALFLEMNEGFALHQIICDQAGRPCDYRFVEVNPSFERLTGLRGEATVGRTFKEVMPGADPDWVRVYGEVASTGVPARFVNHSPILDRYYEVYAYRPAPAQLAVLFTDVTERRQVELEQRDADRRKDDYLAMLSHELRNPLAAIRNAAHVLGLPGLDEQRTQWAKQMIEGQAAHLTGIMNDLLDVSLIARGKIVLKQESVEFGGLVERVLESIRPLADAKEQMLGVQMPSQAVCLHGDPVRLSQVLFNLLHNAVKYTQAGGRITLDARRVGSQLQIEVRDNGIGITPALLPRVFDLFRQGERALDRSDGGLGVGLTVVQKLVCQHGGEVDVRSEGPGRGSTFRVRLPTVDAPATSSGVAIGQMPAAAPSARRVLVVDDHDAVSSSLAALMGAEGYEVRTAASGQDALAIIPAFRPDVVLLDIGLRGMDGFETARRMRALPHGNAFDLIALTGYGDAETRVRAMAAGCDQFLVKPFGGGDLARLVARSGPATDVAK